MNQQENNITDIESKPQNFPLLGPGGMVQPHGYGYINGYHNLRKHHPGVFVRRPHPGVYRPYRPRLPMPQVIAEPEQQIAAVAEDCALFLPMKEISVDGSIIDSMATFKITQVYVNPSNQNPQEENKEEEKPIEVCFKFPKIDDQIISGMKVTIGDKEIEAKIMEKEKAEQKYEDAIAQGN